MAQPSRARPLAAAALAVLVTAAIVMAAVEIGLRIFPSLVPELLLVHFQQHVRQEIASAQGLTTVSMVRPLPRDDGGPTLYLLKPFTTVGFEDHDTHRKGSLTTDSLGFCNAPDVDRLPAVDIVAVGDSFTSCWAVEPSLAWVRRLGMRTGLSAYSMGQGGLGPFEYVQILKQLGLQRHPRIVVMNIYEGNDLRDAARYHEYVAAAQRGEKLYASANNRDSGLGWVLENPLGRRSYAYNLVVVGIDRIVEGLAQQLKPRSEQIDFRYQLRFPDGAVDFNVENRDQGEVVYARRLQASTVTPHVFDEALQAFAKLARDHDFIPIVSYSPAAYTAYADFVSFADPRMGPLMGWYSRTLRGYLADASARLGLVFVDLTPALRAAASQLQGRGLLYSPINVHYLPAGHDVVAAALAKAVMQELSRRSALGTQGQPTN
jgi:hypothetical protein